MMGSTDVVKSAYMVDPRDGLTLIKRDDDDSTEIDREYWQRVNQVDKEEKQLNIFSISTFIFLGGKCFKCSKNV